jgi:GNAT superfamily N-acetyltransferase
MSVLTSPPNYPSDLGALVILSDGTCCSLRPIRPDDAERLVEFHQHLSLRSTYLRFFTVHPTLSAKEVERFTTVDYVDRLAFVVERSGQVIAVGRFDRIAGTSDAEVAFVVADDYQHHGLGSLLLDELARAARDPLREQGDVGRVPSLWLRCVNEDRLRDCLAAFRNRNV